MRLAVYSDYAYRRRGDEVWADEAVMLFLVELERWLAGVTLIGRLDPEPGRCRYRVPTGIDFVALPHYPSLARPHRVLGAFAESVRVFWGSLDQVDAVWLLGPHPFGVPFALLARARGRRVALGVRQDLPVYVSHRHPGNRSLRLFALALEGAWRLLGRFFAVVVVGPDLARRYRRAHRLLPISISLVAESAIASERDAEVRDYTGPIEILSVGRVDAEKNPLLLADVMAELAADGRDWRLTVVGDGDLTDELEQRARTLGVADRVKLAGFIALDDGLLERYRSSHLLLHCSWTEGVPQVLLEAFAARLPIVATAVGGVPDAAAGAAELVPPGNARAAATAVRRIVGDPELRRELTREGAARAHENSMEAVTRQVASFLSLGHPTARERRRPRPDRRRREGR